MKELPSQVGSEKAFVGVGETIYNNPLAFGITGFQQHLGTNGYCNLYTFGNLILFNRF